MRFPYWFLAVFGTVLFSFGCQPPAEEASAPEAAEEATMSDEDMLDTQITAFAEAWNRGDAAAVAALFTEDGNSVDPTGEAFEGRAAVQARYEDLFGGLYQGTSLSLDQSSAKFPKPDVAITTGSFEIAGVKGPDGGETTVKGAYTNVVVKENGEWLIAASRPMIPIELPATGT